jgi:hypothetical protein
MFIPREEAFICTHCDFFVEPLGKGTYRNHCPKCLWSKHVDAEGPGDRASTCGGLMEPMSLDQDGKKGFVIVHKCTKCGQISRNKAAPDDELPGFEHIE